MMLPTTNLFIIKSLNIVGAFDNCMSQESELVPCIQVTKSKWLDYYQNIPVMYLLRIIFYPRCKLNYFSNCLETYYKYLALSFDVPVLVSDIRKLIYSLYDEYAKFYDQSLNINIEQNVHSAEAPTSRIGKGYQLLFQRIKNSRSSSSSSTQNSTF